MEALLRNVVLIAKRTNCTTARLLSFEHFLRNRPPECMYTRAPARVMLA